MNRTVARAGAAIVAVSVLIFSVCMAVSFTFGSYFVCIFLAIGYVITASAFAFECAESRKVSGYAGLAFAAIYAVLILIVYFAQTTSVRLDPLSEQADLLLNYSRGSLMFNYDLLGYGMMALSTFFIGLSMNAESRADRWLKTLLTVHGVFFFGCLILPMTGTFSSMADGEASSGGVIALEFWCAYFFPVGVLSFIHFGKMKTRDPA